MQSRFFILKIKINTFYNKQNIFYVINFLKKKKKNKIKYLIN